MSFRDYCPWVYVYGRVFLLTERTEIRLVVEFVKLLRFFLESARKTPSDEHECFKEQTTQKVTFGRVAFR